MSPRQSMRRLRLLRLLRLSLPLLPSASSVLARRVLPPLPFVRERPPREARSKV